jgi:glucosamine--fructose-6-phosphate aminotransferase (isomerizing)
MVERGFPVLLLRAHGPATEGMDDLLAKLLERGADVVTFADRAASDATRSVVIETGLPEALTPIPFVVAGQVFAFHLARHRGVDPDQPRGLQKITLTR